MSGSGEDKTEAARLRRRWLTLGELLGIAAVLISALTFWNSYRERTNTERERQSSESKSERAATILVLRATTDRDGRVLSLTPRAQNQTVQSQRLRFPAALGLQAIDTTGDARIERSWFSHPLVKLRRNAGAAERTAGDAQLPVAITTQYLVDGEAHVDRALYTIGYSTEHGFLAGTTVRLKGLSRNATIASDAAAARQLDTAWRAQVQPTISSGLKK
ncbi:hypothetical protein [Sphingomonas bacterium]|uniref:hypothetical protein n=1 Tax=Sphingomonas bacterium TaxID=1895847 RepID=UPI0015776469|nr:hypothetical protein [Sphingomonas bacterium]